MQKRNRTHTLALGLAAVLTAALFTSPALSAPIEWVTVGSPNATKDDTGYGAVGYEYRISKYETTNAQYVEFLNAVASKEDLYGLYNVGMANSVHGGITRQGSLGSYSYSLKPGMDNKPVNYVSFYDTLRFANWLNNGKGAGDTESGAYSLGGTNPVGVVRNAGASVFLPSEDEWYKAAYYDAAASVYADYPTGGNSPPACGTFGHAGATANCNLALGTLAAAGSYLDATSPFGTYDQAGNVAEWVHGLSAVRRGGEFQFNITRNAFSGQRTALPSLLYSSYNTGFRVGSAEVPEPGSGLLLLNGVIYFAALRRRNSVSR